MTTEPHVNIYRLDGFRLRRWTFAHVAGNGRRQTSRQTYVSKWNATRAASKLYPTLPLFVGRWGNNRDGG